MTRASSPQATAKGWMMPRSTPAVAVPGAGPTSISAVTSSTTRPASTSSVTALTWAGG